MDVARHDPIEARSCKFGISGDAAPRLKRRPGAVDCSMDTCDVHRVDQHREWIGVARNAVIHGQGLSLRLVNHRLGTPRDAPGSSSLRQKSAPPARPDGTRSAETRFEDGPVRLSSLVGSVISKAYLPSSRYRRRPRRRRRRPRTSGSSCATDRIIEQGCGVSPPK